MLCVASLSGGKKMIQVQRGKNKRSVSKKTDQFKCHLAWAERLNHPPQAGASVHAHTHRPRKASPTENRTQGRSSGQCFHSKISSQDFPRLVSSHFPWGLILLQRRGTKKKGHYFRHYIIPFRYDSSGHIRR